MKTPLALTILRSVHTVRAFTLLFLGAALLPATGVTAPSEEGSQQDVQNQLLREAQAKAQEIIAQAHKDFNYIQNSLLPSSTGTDLQESLVRAQRRAILYLEKDHPGFAIAYLAQFFKRVRKLDKEKRDKLIQTISRLDESNSWPIQDKHLQEITRHENAEIRKLSLSLRETAGDQAVIVAAFLLNLALDPSSTLYYGPVLAVVFVMIRMKRHKKLERLQLFQLAADQRGFLQSERSFGKDPLRKIICETNFERLIQY